MALSNDLARQFARVTNTKDKTKRESTVYGTAKMYDGIMCVQADGSELFTPVDTAVAIKEGDRVTVMIKDHRAIVTGNITDPSAGSIVVGNIGNRVEGVSKELSEFETIMADEITVDELTAILATIGDLRAVTAEIGSLEAINAAIDNLEAKYADIEKIDAETIEALNADIENLEVLFAEIEDLDVEHMEAVEAHIGQLKGYNAEFTYVSAEVLSAVKADIKQLDVDKLSAKDADLKYVNIDFANIDEAWFRKFYADSGIIEYFVSGEGHFTGELVGVTIKGDLIEAGTLRADRLVVKGSDGNYYKLNTDFEAMPGVEPVEEDMIHGSSIVAESITAEKIAVDDLVAFDATIAGFNITRKPYEDGKIYSGTKSSVNSTVRGIYLDDTGQMAVGDSNNFLRYFKDEYGNYKLEISADSIYLGSSGKNVEEAIDDIEIGAVNLIRNSVNLIYSDYYFDGEGYSDPLVAVHDGNGNVVITSARLNVTHDDAGNAVLTGIYSIDDGAGTVILT